MAKNKVQLIADTQRIIGMPDGKEKESAIAQLNIDTDEFIKSRQIPENHPNVQALYEGFKNLGALAKPMTMVTTPITETARGLIREVGSMTGTRDWDTPPIDPLAEFKTGDLLPSDRASTSLLYKDAMKAMGIETQPVAKISSKDYPRAAKFLTQLTDPSVAAGIGTDVMIGKGVSAMAPEAIHRTGISKDAALSYLRSTSKNPQLLQELEQSGKIHELANMVASEPEKYLHQFKPNTVYQQIMGPIEKGRRDIGAGELAKITELQNQMIEEIPRDVYSIPREELQKASLSKLDKMVLEAGQKESAANIIKKNISVMQPDQSKIDKIKLQNEKALQLKEVISSEPDYIKNPEFIDEHLTPSQKPEILNTEKVNKIRSIKSQIDELFDPSAQSQENYVEMIRQRNEEPIGFASDMRRLGNKLMEPAVPGEVSTDVQAKNLAGRAIESASRDAQSQAMSFMPQESIDIYDYQNKKISNLMNMRDLMQGNLKSRDYIGLPTENLMGRTGLGGFIEKNYGRYVRPTASEANVAIKNIADTAREQFMGKINPYATVAMKRGIVENLSNYQIPRDANEILKNPQIAIAKIAQVTNDKNLISSVTEALENHPEKLDALMPALTMQFPNIFEADPYQRVNGKILDPIIREKAKSDIMASGKTNTEKMMLINGINKDGSLPKEMFK